MEYTKDKGKSESDRQHSRTFLHQSDATNIIQGTKQCDMGGEEDVDVPCDGASSLSFADRAAQANGFLEGWPHTRLGERGGEKSLD